MAYAYRGWLVALAVLAGCVEREGPTIHPEKNAATVSQASRIYTVGEQKYAQARYAEAVALWRHAVLELPPTSDFDQLRHRLLLRRAHAQLMAWEQTQDRRYLTDGQTTLERYAKRHEALFGDDDDARAERGEIYELLFEFDRRVDAPEPAASEPGDGAQTSAEHDEGYEEQGEFRRTVVVGRRSVDEEGMRQALRSPFSDPFSPQGRLTAPKLVLFHGPRPLLRAGGFAQPAPSAEPSRGARAHARKLGSSLLSTARADLKSCYEDAYARQPVSVARPTVEVEFDDDGRVREAVVVEGGLVDLLGTLCLQERLEATHVETVATRRGTKIRLPMTFFYQGPVYIMEGSGISAPAKVFDELDVADSLAPSGRPGSAIEREALGA